MAENEPIRCMQLPLKNMQQSDDWFAGMISWRGVSVPIVSFEKMCQGSFDPPDARSRIAIIYNLNGGDDLPYFGIILKDIPRAYLAEDDRMIESIMPSTLAGPLVTRADAMIDGLWIPDLDAAVASIRERMQG